MNKANCLYEAPTTEILVLRIEEGILQASIYGEEGAAGKKLGNGGVFNFDD